MADFITQLKENLLNASMSEMDYPSLLPDQQE